MFTFQALSKCQLSLQCAPCYPRLSSSGQWDLDPRNGGFNRPLARSLRRASDPESGTSATPQLRASQPVVCLSMYFGFPQSFRKLTTWRRQRHSCNGSSNPCGPATFHEWQYLFPSATHSASDRQLWMTDSFRFWLLVSLRPMEKLILSSAPGTVLASERNPTTKVQIPAAAPASVPPTSLCLNDDGWTRVEDGKLTV